jgi:hypothetical protein
MILRIKGNDDLSKHLNFPPWGSKRWGEMWPTSRKFDHRAQKVPSKNDRINNNTTEFLLYSPGLAKIILPPNKKKLEVNECLFQEQKFGRQMG